MPADIGRVCLPGPSMQTPTMRRCEECNGAYAKIQIPILRAAPCLRNSLGISPVTSIDIKGSIYQLDHDPAQAVAQKEDVPVLDVPSLES